MTQPQIPMTKKPTSSKTHIITFGYMRISVPSLSHALQLVKLLEKAQIVRSKKDGESYLYATYEPHPEFIHHEFEIKMNQSFQPITEPEHTTN